MIVSRPSRVALWSSTIAILIMIDSLQRQAELDSSASARMTVDLTLAPKGGDSLAHSRQAVIARGLRRRFQPASIVLHRNCQLVLSHRDFQSDFGRLGMAHDIIERLFEGQKDAVAQPGIERVLWKMIGDLQAAGNSGQVQKALSEQRIVTGQG